MSSALTRSVFRQLLQSEPLAHPKCLRPPLARGVRRAVRIPKRGFFGFVSPQPKEKPKIQTIDPGLATMIELGSRLKLRVRPHPREELISALASFVTSKNRSSYRSQITDIQVDHCLATMHHLQEISEDGRSGLSPRSLENCLQLLKNSLGSPNDLSATFNQNRLEFAKLVYDEAVTTGNSPATQNHDFKRTMVRTYIQVLGSMGRGSEAMKVLESYQRAGNGTEEDNSLWIEVICGFVSRDEQHGRQSVVKLMRSKGLNYNTGIQQAIIETLVDTDTSTALDAAKFWFRLELAGGQEPSRKSKLLLVQLCMKHGETQLGQEIITEMVQKEDLDLDCWNTILAWTIATGKGVQELKRLIQVMERRTAEQGSKLAADVSTINAVYRAATWQDNKLLPERVLGLASELGITPNTTTWLMEVENRLSQGDTQGAVEAYDQVRARSYELEAHEDAAVVNKLVVTLCRQDNPSMDQAMGLVADMLERQLPFEPTTVSELSLLHMRRDELHNAIDLLKTYTQHFDNDGRAMIRDSLVHFCLDRDTSTSLAWDAYIIVHELFNETPRATREVIMESFFKREREDMAVHVFGHMRQFSLPERRPSARTYQKCFEGIAIVSGDEEILDTVHNMLKLDSEVDPDTRLKNSLMLAQSAAGRSSLAMKMWREMIESEEGPSYESIRIALMACERLPDGATEARRIWDQLNEMGVELTREIYLSYTWTLAGQDLVDEAKDMMTQLEARFGKGPDVVALATLFNVTPSRDDIETWAAATYPEVWKEVLKYDKVVGTQLPLEYFNVDRGVRS